jgi:phage N-6-adenine-methyltransferase
MNRGGSRQDYETPADFMAALVARFGQPDFDLAASHLNAKASHWYDSDTDSLAQSWENKGLCWLNPPFSNIGRWAEKCAHESHEFCRDGRLHAGAKILFLVPASVGSNWFAEHVAGKALVLFLQGRLTFVGAKDPYPKDCILACYGFGKPGYEVWKWR